MSIWVLLGICIALYFVMGLIVFLATCFGPIWQKREIFSTLGHWWRAIRRYEPIVYRDRKGIEIEAIGCRVNDQMSALEFYLGWGGFMLINVIVWPIAIFDHDQWLATCEPFRLLAKFLDAPSY